MARKKESLRDIMEFFGVEFGPDKKGSEWVGTCFSCDKPNHLYVNSTKNVYKCQKCGTNGNTHNFLEFIWASLKQGITMSLLNELAEYRKLPVEALVDTDIGYAKGVYFFPVRTHDGRFTDFRWYKIGEKAKSVTGAITGLYGAEELSREGIKYDKIWICEGEFDRIALNYVFKKTSKPDHAVSLPGVNNLKRDFCAQFMGENAVLAYDFDAGGRSGRDKAFDLLNPPLTESLKFIDWPDTFPQSYDVNNFVTAVGVKDNDYELCYNRLSSMLSTVKDPSAPEEVEEDLKPEIYIEGPVTFEQLIERYRDNLELNSNYINAIKLCFATIMSIRVAGPNPVWLFLVGPPGYGKTAILSSFSDSSHCVFQSSISKHNLVSGFDTGKRGDPSVFNRLKDKCFILKDYTEILAKTQTDRQEIFGILRGAFDGSVERDFGNGVKRRYYNLNFPCLAGVTDEINNHSTASVGERFLKFDIHAGEIDEEAQQEKALFGALFGETSNEVLHAYVNFFLDQDWDFSEERIKHIVRTSPFKSKMNAMCRLAVWIRTPVIRHEFGHRQNQVAYTPRKESANRVTVQLHKLAITLAILEGKNTIDEEIFDVVSQVALNTVDGYKYKLLRLLYDEEMPKQPGYLSRRIGVGHSQITQILEDLELTSLVVSKNYQTNGAATTKIHVELNKEVRQLWDTARN